MHAIICRSNRYRFAVSWSGDTQCASFPLCKLLIWNTRSVLALRAGRGNGICLAAVHPPARHNFKEGWEMKNIFRRLWRDDEAQDIAEYAVMLAVILVIVVGTIRLIGANANNVFSSVASSIAQ
jgi:Flp pilus assembly pilin Flp